MTHEELLKSIEFGHTPLVFEALWKVAKLHKPIVLNEDYVEIGEEPRLTCECDPWDEYEYGYPCPTIQMIESVLPLVNLSPDMA